MVESGVDVAVQRRDPGGGKNFGKEKEEMS
jgi:hypothetical protein